MNLQKLGGAPTAPEFMTWLLEHSFEIVGLLGIHSTYADPICMFLRSRGMAEPTVDDGGNYQYLDDSGEIREVEALWMKVASYEIETHLRGAVTGRQVLETLDNVKDMMYNEVR